MPARCLPDVTSVPDCSSSIGNLNYTVGNDRRRLAQYRDQPDHRGAAGHHRDHRFGGRRECIGRLLLHLPAGIDQRHPGER